jgi:hypothetical protein
MMQNTQVIKNLDISLEKIINSTPRVKEYIKNESYTYYFIPSYENDILHKKYLINAGSTNNIIFTPFSTISAIQYD